jgi:hypothetical protein
MREGETSALPFFSSVVVMLTRNRLSGTQRSTGRPVLPLTPTRTDKALFSAENPGKLIARTDEAFFKPEKSWEQSGQYAAGTIFAEGLVFFHGKWFPYYGCADSRVGVAVFDPKASHPRCKSQRTSSVKGCKTRAANRVAVAGMAGSATGSWSPSLASPAYCSSARHCSSRVFCAPWM